MDENSTEPKRASSSGRPVFARRRGPRRHDGQRDATGRGSRRSPRRGVKSRQHDDHAGDRQFITALARGLEVLSAYRAGDGPLGNQELSERTGMPRPTISRITHTLTQLGYLSFNRRLETYDLGGGILSLSFVAMATLDIRGIARPAMQELAHGGTFNVGLARRDKLMMVMVETVESESLVSLRLPVGSRMPIATTAIGRAYLAALPDSERDAILDELRPQFGADWTNIRRGIEKAMRDIERQGFCTSVGEWQRDINGAGVAIPMPDGRESFGMDLGGPAYLLPEAEIIENLGPRLAQAARTITASLSPRRASQAT